MTAGAPLAAALAANDAEIALAWVDRFGFEPPVLRFARLSPSLELIGMASIDDPAFTAYVDDVRPNVHLAVAALPTGWAIVGYVDGDVFLYAFDASGVPGVRTIIDRVAPTYWSNGHPTLAARPNGGPLVVWHVMDAVRVAVIADDGRSATAPLNLPRGDGYGSRATAAFAAGAFHVMITSETPTNPWQLEMSRIRADGTLASTFDALPGVIAPQARLVSGADDLRIVYGDGQRSVWSKVGPTGELLSSLVVIGSGLDFGGDARPVGFGADTVALLVGVTPAKAIGITRVGADGEIVAPAYKIASGPDVYAAWYDIVRRGPDAVVVWLGFSGGLRIARVAP